MERYAPTMTILHCAAACGVVEIAGKAIIGLAWALTERPDPEKS